MDEYWGRVVEGMKSRSLGIGVGFVRVIKRNFEVKLVRMFEKRDERFEGERIGWWCYLRVVVMCGVVGRGSM